MMGYFYWGVNNQLGTRKKGLALSDSKFANRLILLPD